MATPIYDTFTDTSGTYLESHTPDIGGAWVRHPSYTSAKLQISNANRCRKDAVAAQTAYYNASDPGADDYTVSAVYRYLGTTISAMPAVCARMNDSVVTMYMVRYYPDSTVWQLYKLVSGTPTLIGSWSETLTAGDERLCELDVSGTTISVRIAGTTRISVTDSSITARGYAGIRDGSAVAGSDTAGIHLDNFTVTNSLAVWARRASGIWTPGRR